MLFEVSPAFKRLSHACLWISDWYNGAADEAGRRGLEDLVPIYDDIGNRAFEWSELPARDIKPAIRQYMEQISQKANKTRDPDKFSTYDDILDTLERNIPWR